MTERVPSLHEFLAFPFLLAQTAPQNTTPRAQENPRNSLRGEEQVYCRSKESVKIILPIMGFSME